MTDIANYKFSPWRVQGDRRVVASEATWKKPLKWDREAAEDLQKRGCRQLDGSKAGVSRPRVLVGPDVFEDWTGPMVDAQGRTLYVSPGAGIWVPSDFQYMRDRLTMDDVRLRLFRLFSTLENLDILLLTKRPENVLPMLNRIGDMVDTYEAERLSKWFLERVWLGVSVENQAAADERIPILLKTPAAVRFLSMEPLLGPVDLHLRIPADTSQPKISGILSGIHWVIVGGESGHGARPMHPDWVRSIRDQCQAAGVPFFFKQWGEWIHAHPAELHLSPAPLVDWEGLKMQRVGKRAAGRLLDGREWSEIP